MTRNAKRPQGLEQDGTARPSGGQRPSDTGGFHPKGVGGPGRNGAEVLTT